MGNDISMVRRASAVALVVALAGCAAREATLDDGPTPYEPQASAPQTTPAEGGEAVALKEDAPLRYVVQKGDTLWGIANKFLKDSWQWPELWYVNPKVANPHLIYPGDELYLYFVDGQAHLAKADQGPAPGEGQTGPTPPADVLPPGGLGTFTPSARELPIDQAILTIPAEQIRAFLRGPRVIDEDELDDAPYIVAFEEKKLLGAADSIAYALDVEDQSISQYQIVRRS